MAAEETIEKKNAGSKAEDRKPEPVDQITVTRHRARIGGKQLAYTVTCGTMVIREEAEKEGLSEGERARAKVFFIAYALDDVKNKAKRPLTFSFNGGPGSSSVWLHLGVLGPRRVALDDEGFAPLPPGHLVANEHSLLDVSDLVFIDPVGTAWSEPRLIALAYAFEQATKHRRAPTYPTSINTWNPNAKS
jgi:carboxypeptidase C (cathepsin A)